MDTCPACKGKHVYPTDEGWRCGLCGGYFDRLPNLDHMTGDELREFWGKYKSPTRLVACRLVGPRPDNMTVVATAAAYAIAKAVAVQAQTDGKIQVAMTYEKHCDLYYQDIPKDVRW